MEVNAKRKRFNRSLMERSIKKFGNSMAQREYYKRNSKKRIELPAELTVEPPKEIVELRKARRLLSGPKSKSNTTRSLMDGAKTPKAWLRDIAAIDDVAIRASVACVVWWDFFAIRDRSDGREYWDHLDAFMAEWRDGTPECCVASALVSCGYHPLDAARRSVGGELLS